MSDFTSIYVMCIARISAMGKTHADMQKYYKREDKN